MISNKKVKIKFNLAVFFLSVIVLLSFAMTLVCFPSFAEEEKSTPRAELFMPEKRIESRNLNSPIGSCVNKDFIAILDNHTEDPALYISKGNQIIKNGILLNNDDENPVDTDHNYACVKMLDENTLFYSDKGFLYKVDLSSFPVITPEKVELGESVSYFDIVDKYLITWYSTNVDIFTLGDSGYTKTKTIECQEKTPIAINSDGKAFYMDKGSNLCIYNVIGDEERPVCKIDGKINKFVANNAELFYIKNNDTTVYKMDINTILTNPETVELKIKNPSSYDLGNIKSPVDISIKDNHSLLITDNVLNAVQEYIITDNNQLVFTGFAVASGKTAYNRISKNASHIDKYLSKIAVLDNNKLSVITNSENMYDIKNYQNFQVDTLGENLGSFVLGKESVLLIFNKANHKSYLKLLSLKDSTLSEPVTISDDTSENAETTSNYIIRDICFESGYFYIVCDNGNEITKIYRAKENITGDEKFEFLPVCKIEGSIYKNIAVDSLNNIYLSNENQIISLSEIDDYAEKKILLSAPNTITKMDADLSGCLFVLDNFIIKYFNGSEFIPLTIDSVSDKIIDFALDDITDSAFFIYQNCEFIAKSTDMGNVALNDLVIPDSFITNAPNADIEKLKIYRPKDNANVYTINKNEQFEYVSTVKSTEDYAYICDVNLPSLKGSEFTLMALAGKKNLILIEKSQTLNVTEEVLNKTTAPESAFITTDVNGYFLPVITENDNYILKDGENIRLKKLDEIHPLYTITFLDTKFYFAEFLVNNTTYSGYIPMSFTVEVLSEDFSWNEFTTEHIDSTTLYSDKELTESIKQLDNNTIVKVIEKNDSYLYVAVKEDDGYTLGYISTDVIKNLPQKAIRNIIIIVAVSVCVLTTATYFILRKKKN